MFQNLQRKWKAGKWQLLLILATFALGGSLTGMAGRFLMQWIPVKQPLAWTVLYILLVTLLWPIAVILVSLPFGQFPFFKSYLRRIFSRISGKKKIRLAIFASGDGSNAQKIMERFQHHPAIEIALVISNKPRAGVLQRAKTMGVPIHIINKIDFFETNSTVSFLKERKIDFIVLAGFLWKLPQSLINAYPSRIINIHPALLPKFGGKGMYGHFVHEAVIAAGEKTSGITIHYVDEQYDHGGAIFQASCPVDPGDNPESLAEKIHALEHFHFPRVIEETILTQVVKK